MNACLQMETQRSERLREFTLRENVSDVSFTASNDQFLSLIKHADQARLRGEYREAVKWTKKAIALEPAETDGYLFLATIYSDSTDGTNALPQFLKVMDLTDTGTDFNLQFGDQRWAKAASSAVACLIQCDAPKPAWFTDTQQLKRMADRAVAALPDNYLTLQMRIEAYRRTPELDLSLE